MKLGTAGDFGPPEAHQAIARTLFLYAGGLAVTDFLRDLFSISEEADSPPAVKEAVRQWARRWHLAEDAWALRTGEIVVERCRDIGGPPQSRDAALDMLLVDTTMPDWAKGVLGWPTEAIWVTHEDGSFGDPFPPMEVTLNAWRPHLEEQPDARARLEREFKKQLAAYLADIVKAAKAAGFEKHPEKRALGRDHFMWAALYQFTDISQESLAEQIGVSREGVVYGLRNVAEAVGLQTPPHPKKHGRPQKPEDRPAES